MNNRIDGLYQYEKVELIGAGAVISACMPYQMDACFSRSEYFTASADVAY